MHFKIPIMMTFFSFCPTKVVIFDELCKFLPNKKTEVDWVLILYQIMFSSLATFQMRLLIASRLTYLYFQATMKDSHCNTYVSSM